MNRIWLYSWMSDLWFHLKLELKKENCTPVTRSAMMRKASDSRRDEWKKLTISNQEIEREWRAKKTWISTVTPSESVLFRWRKKNKWLWKMDEMKDFCTGKNEQCFNFNAMWNDTKQETLYTQQLCYMTHNTPTGKCHVCWKW